MGDGAQLVIDGDADGLEAALGRVLLLPQGGGRHGALDNLHQFQGGGNGLLGPVFRYGPGDAAGIALFAIVPQDAVQPLLRPGVHHLIGGEAVPRIHAHIQGRVPHIGKAPLDLIQLGRGDAKIEKHPVHAGDAQRINNLGSIGKVAVD